MIGWACRKWKVVRGEGVSGENLGVDLEPGILTPDSSLMSTPPTSEIPHAAAPSGTLRTDSLVDSVALLLGLTAMQRLVGFVRAVLFCRWLDADQLGQWDMAFSFLYLAAPIAVLAVPGAFGRYLEHYRQQGQLRVFIRRTAVLCASAVALAVVVAIAARGWFSELVFGTPEHFDLVVLAAFSLAALAGYNFTIELFTALRNVRAVSLLQMLHSVAFAVLGIWLLVGWRNSAAGVLVAYGASCLVALGVACWWLTRSWRCSPRFGEPVAHRALWGKMMPFAGWILLSSFLANSFQIADRYMIVHHSGMPSAEALAQVGAYHSSRVVPLLLLSIAVMLGTMATPHLSHDWESGRRERVDARLRLYVKLVGFGLFAAAVAVLFIAPVLFHVGFRGKFSGGLAVLPWTLCYCLWFGMVMLLENYLWCAERARLAGLALGAGLAVNVGLNLLLLPPLGLLGAVLATTVANLVALALVCWFNHRLGFRLDPGTRVVLALPLTVCLGPGLATAVLLLVALRAVRGEHLLSADEKRQIARGLEEYSERLRRVPWLGCLLARSVSPMNPVAENRDEPLPT